MNVFLVTVHPGHPGWMAIKRVAVVLVFKMMNANELVQKNAFNTNSMLVTHAQCTHRMTNLVNYVWNKWRCRVVGHVADPWVIKFHKVRLHLPSRRQISH